MRYANAFVNQHHPLSKQQYAALPFELADHTRDSDTAWLNLIQ
jgi:hypothetical protein